MKKYRYTIIGRDSESEPWHVAYQTNSRFMVYVYWVLAGIQYSLVNIRWD